MPASYVYFIQDVPSSLVKIGRSVDPTARLSVMRLYNPNELVILGVIVTNNAPSLERELHGLFREHHRHNEWFTATPELYAYVAASCSPMPTGDRRPRFIRECVKCGWGMMVWKTTGEALCAYCRTGQKRAA